MQSLNGKTTGDSLTAAEWNQVPSELQNLITSIGISLSGGDLTQITKAITGYVATGDFYTTTGSADAYVLSPLSGYPGPSAYYNGMRVRFIPNVANTGAAVTVNVNGLGLRNVVRQDAAGNSSDTEYQVGVMVELRYDSTAGEFKLLRIPNSGTAVNQYGLSRVATQTEVNTGSNTTLTVSPATLEGRTSTESRGGVIEIATQAETNTGSDDTRSITPLKLAVRLGLLGSDDIANDSSVAGTDVSDALEDLESQLVAIGANQKAYLSTAQVINNTTPEDVTDWDDVLVTESFSVYELEGQFAFDTDGSGGITINFDPPISAVMRTGGFWGGTSGGQGQWGAAIVIDESLTVNGVNLVSWRATLVTFGAGGAVGVTAQQTNGGATDTSDLQVGGWVRMIKMDAP